MARDQGPVSEEEFEELQEAMDEQREELHEALADDLGGDPEDYEVDRRTAADGGE